MAINREFIVSGARPQRGLLKIITMALCLVLLICAAVVPGVSVEEGWLGFVGGIVLFTDLMWFILYLVNLNQRFPPVMFIVELGFLIGYAVLVLIATIVACVVAPYHGGFTGYAIFGFPTLGVICYDLALFVIAWRSGNNQAESNQEAPPPTAEEARY